MFARVFFDSADRPASSTARCLNLLLVLAAISFGSYAVFAQALTGWSTVWPYHAAFFHGWLISILLCVLSLVCSVLFGTLAALARRSSFLPLRSIAILYVELIRGTPLLVQILFFYYGVFNALGLNNRDVAGVLILSLFTGAYIAEMIRAGIESVPASQWESARAIGFTTVQTYRFVVMPQAIRQILPPLAGQLASLIKDSSLLSIIGVAEFTLNAQQASYATYTTMECYLPLAIGYLLLTLPISLLAKRLEEKFRYES
ncbi:MAG: amino acid ABC transporter permease [Chthoniobacterales bacterium]